MTQIPHPPSATHIRLLAGHATAGHPVFEVLPALAHRTGLFELVGSPGLVLGCAAGDLLDIAEDGQFEVIEQGANLCIQAYRRDRFTPESFAELEAALSTVGGLAEAPPDLRFIVVTLDRSTSVSTIENLMNTWVASTDGTEWWFGTADRAVPAVD